MKLLVAALVMALAVPAVAGPLINSGDLVAVDGNGRSIINTFYKCEGDSVLFNYETASYGVQDTASVTIDPTGQPGWLIVQFEEETNSLTAWFRFTESVDGRTYSQTAGDWVPVYLGGEYREAAFNVGLWSQCEIVYVGSAEGITSLYWRAELISD